MLYDINGSKSLLNAFIQELKELGYEHWTGDFSTMLSLRVDTDDKDYRCNDRPNGAPEYILPRDWDEALEEIKSRTKPEEEEEEPAQTTINGVTVQMPRGDQDCYIVIIDPSDQEEIEIEEDEFNALENLFDEDETELRFGNWNVSATTVKIGCTGGFTAEHLTEIKNFIEENE